MTVTFFYLLVVELLPSEVKARLVQIQKLDEKIQGVLKIPTTIPTLISCGISSSTGKSE